MIHHNQSQEQNFYQNMIQNLSILQMNKTALNLYIDKICQNNPLISTNAHNPWHNPKSFQGEIFEDILEQEQTLFYQLREELLLDIEQEDEALIYLIIGNLDKHGYLHTPLKDLVQGTDFSLNQAEKIRRLILNSSHLGLGALNQEEYIITVIEKNYSNISLERELFKLLKNKRSKIDSYKIAKQLKKNQEDIEIALYHLQKIPINPMGQKTLFVYPDFIVEIENNSLIIKSTRNSTPTISINEITTQFNKTELTHYKKEAQALQKVLEKRKNSLQKYAEALIIQRSDFFFENQNTPQNLGLKELSDIISYHPSTISRALRNRYFIFNKEIYPFSILWTHQIGTSNQHDVKNLITDIIAHEDPENPLSDSAITRILNKKGITISRRTVNKYRHILKISSLYQR